MSHDLKHTENLPLVPRLSFLHGGGVWERNVVIVLCSSVNKQQIASGYETSAIILPYQREKVFFGDRPKYFASALFAILRLGKANLTMVSVAVSQTLYPFAVPWTMLVFMADRRARQ